MVAVVVVQAVVVAAAAAAAEEPALVAELQEVRHRRLPQEPLKQQVKVRVAEVVGAAAVRLQRRSRQHQGQRALAHQQSLLVADAEPLQMRIRIVPNQLAAVVAAAVTRHHGPGVPKVLSNTPHLTTSGKPELRRMVWGGWRSLVRPGPNSRRMT